MNRRFIYHLTLFPLLALAGPLSAATFNIANGDVATLVNAMTVANGNNQDDTINLAVNGTYIFSAVNNNAVGPCATPVVGYDGTNPNFHSLTINANGSTITRSTAAGTPDFRFFTLKNVKVFTLNNAILTNGHLGNFEGGAIYINGTTTLHHCTIANNVVSAGGGGINNVADTVLLDGCSIVNNQTTAGHGGGIKSWGGTMTLVNCTVANNGFEGLANVGQSNAAYAVVHNSTFIGNKIYNADVTFICQINIGSCIFSNSAIDNHTTSSTFALIASDGYNLATDNGGGFLTGTGDKINTDPKFDPAGLIAEGPVVTIALTYGSPAIDAGKSFGATSDERGSARIINNTAVPNASDGADIGAYEAPIDAVQYGDPSFVVNTSADHNDGVCGGIDCTLREALARIDSLSAPPTDNVSFASGITGTLTLTGGELFLHGANITGPGARSLALSANTQTRIFTVTAGVNAIRGLTIRDGFVAGATGASTLGGGIYNGAGLTLEDCAIVHNRVLGGSALYNTSNAGGTGRGGGIYNAGSLAVNRCTFGGPDSNSANGAGGGNGGDHPTDADILYHGGKGGGAFGGAIFNDTSGNMSVVNSTIAGNYAGGGGGGAANFGGAGGDAVAGIYNLGSMIVSLCTISANNATSGAGGDSEGGPNGAPGRADGGIRADSGSTNRAGSTIIAGNTRNTGGSPDAAGTFTSDGFNLVGANSAVGFTAVGDQTGTIAAPRSAMLGPIQNNGGPTDTMLPVTGSPAIDQGHQQYGYNMDQRGFVRPMDNPFLANATGGDGSDIGAVEADGSFVRIRRVAREGYDLSIYFDGTNGKTFKLERKFSITDDWSFIPFANDTTTGHGEGSIEHITDFNAASYTKVYYRVRQL